MERVNRQPSAGKAKGNARPKTRARVIPIEASPTDAVLERIAVERLALLFHAGEEFGYGAEYADIVVENFLEQLKRHEYDRARRLYISRRGRVVEHGEIARAEAEAAFDEMRGNVRRFKPRLKAALAQAIQASGAKTK
jgi:hypothetical protein